MYRDYHGITNLHGIAFTELVAFMEDLRKVDIAPVFKLTDLAFMYKTQLEQLGADVEGWMHTSRLKERLLSVLPDLQTHSQGKCIILRFNEDIGGKLVILMMMQCTWHVLHK